MKGSWPTLDIKGTDRSSYKLAWWNLSCWELYGVRALGAGTKGR